MFTSQRKRPARGNKRKGGQNRRSSSRKSRWNDTQFTCRVSGFDTPFLAGTVTTSPGLLQAQDAVPTDTGGTFSILSAHNLGTRLNNLAEIYNEYRINRLQFRYRPATYNDVTTGVIAPATLKELCVAGFIRDPARGILSVDEVTMSGGRTFSLDRPFKFNFSSAQWLYTDPAGSSSADVRFYSPGNFYAMSYSNSSLTATWGVWELFWDVSFRYPKDPISDDVAKPDPLQSLKQNVLSNRALYASKHEQKDDHKQQTPSKLDSANPFQVLTNLDDEHYQPVVRPPSSTPKLKINLSSSSITKRVS